jgi:hypothetical protein
LGGALRAIAFVKITILLANLKNLTSSSIDQQDYITMRTESFCLTSKCESGESESLILRAMNAIKTSQSGVKLRYGTTLTCVPTLT